MRFRDYRRVDPHRAARGFVATRRAFRTGARPSKRGGVFLEHPTDRPRSPACPDRITVPNARNSP